MDIAGSTRSATKRTHALISEDGRVNSVIPGWTGCIVNVLINEQMGARFCQTIATFNKADGTISGRTVQSQFFLYLVNGQISASAGNQVKDLRAGQYMYVPPGKEYRVKNLEAGTQLLTFQKVYEPLDGTPPPNVIIGNAAEVPAGN